jgi:pre-60S factor REI1
MDVVINENRADNVITCIACRLEFTDNVVMKEHYKSDFHRFNLKRKAAGLPSVNQQLFDQKVQSATNPKQAKKGTGHLKNGGIGKGIYLRYSLKLF